MAEFSTIKSNFKLIKYRKIVLASILIGFLTSFLAIALKRGTEHYEELLFHQASSNKFLFLIFPLIGLTIIAILRYFLFKKKKNKGITEIFETTSNRKNSLPIYKIPSHLINGFFTVIFGGSTGIEVSTVVASATVGSVAQEKENILNQHKTELICAGVASGIAALFFSPIAGILFAYEVIAKKVSKIFILTTSIATIIAVLICVLLDEKSLFHAPITTWHLKAIPFFIVLGIIAGMNSVYLTKCVIFFKQKFNAIKKTNQKIILSATIFGISLIVLPQLYGDGYHAIKESLISANQLVLSLPVFITILSIIVFKPIVTSITLAGGGDGGVFAPSIFIGGFVGLLLAIILNTYFGLEVIPLNFMIIGMGAMLSASIHAPFTATFLACGLFHNYNLFIPIFISCFTAKIVAQKICSYTVYSYSKN